MPPPPVDGAPIGTGLGDGLADGLGDPVAAGAVVVGVPEAVFAVPDAGAEAGAEAGALAEGLAEDPGATAVKKLPLGVAVAEAPPAADVPVAVQAVAAASTVSVPQPIAASLARPVMEPPGTGTPLRCGAGNGLFSIEILGYASRRACGRAAVLAEPEWRRIYGFRVVFTSAPGGFTPPPRRSIRARLAGAAGVVFLLVGVVAIGVAVAAQVHAPQPSAAAAGSTGGGDGPSLARSLPVSVEIPSIGVSSNLLHLGLNADGTIQVPSVSTAADEAAWYKYSATPGQMGASVIEGHVDTHQGPAVFFRLGALRPGEHINVTLADGVTAVFRVTGVRQYSKMDFPSRAIYGASGYAALHLITCGGAFDYATGHYLSTTVVFASLTSSRLTSSRGPKLTAASAQGA